ncbi:MAG: acyltransferase [Alphaproteobacteria bacterium]|nr:acyltransferase [Alphaproteobacteria bacterium]
MNPGSQPVIPAKAGTQGYHGSAPETLGPGLRRDDGIRIAAPAAHYPYLTVLRGFAAMLVFWYHIIALNWPSFPTSPDILRLLHFGWVGVDLFFVLSGFVISASAMQLYDASPHDAQRVFLKRRAARLLPLYYLTLLMAILTVQHIMVTHPWFWGHMAAHLLLVHNLHHNSSGSIGGPNWSVGVEAQFYVVILLIMPWLSRLKPWHVLAGGLLLAFVTRGAVLAVAEAQSREELWRVVYAMQVPTMADAFGIGMALALLARRGVLARLSPRQGLALAAGGGILLYLSFLLLWEMPDYWRHARTLVFWRCLPALCFGMILAGVSRIPAGNGPLMRGFTYLGDISYGIYLWHLLVILLLQQSGIAKDNPSLFAALAVPLVLGLSALTWHALEKPAIKQFR